MLQAMSSFACSRLRSDRRLAAAVYAAFYFYPDATPAGRARTS
jgi:hypothetical protein